MEGLGIMDIAAGVLIGNLLTGAFFFSLKAADKIPGNSWGDVPMSLVAGVVLPLAFAAVSIYLWV